ncbi:MAG: hypothetical protein ABJF01_07235 [bacterium]
MNEWVPVAIGAALVVIARGIARFYPNSFVGHELRRSYGVSPTGERGVRTRHDHLRSSGLALIAAAVLLPTGIGTVLFAQRLPDDSMSYLVALAYGFGAILMGLLAAGVLLFALWKAARWRVELPDTPEHRRALADAIDRLLDGGVSAAEHTAVLQVRYLHPEIEEIRRATLRLISKHPSGLPDGFREQIKNFTATIRGSTE